MRANVISSRSYIRPAMFDLELKWTAGVGGGGRAKALPFHPRGGGKVRLHVRLARRGYIHPLISCASLHFGK